MPLIKLRVLGGIDKLRVRLLQKFESVRPVVTAKMKSSTKAVFIKQRNETLVFNSTVIIA